MNFPLDADLCDQITRKTLLDSYYNLLDGALSIPIFSTDEETDKKKVKKLLKSFYGVIDWYSTEEQMKTVRKVKDD